MENVTTSSLTWLIWSGATVSVIGLFGLIWCIIKIAGAKRAGLGDEDMRNALKSVMPLNLAALFLSVIGLMMIVIGILLG